MEYWCGARNVSGGEITVWTRSNAVFFHQRSLNNDVRTSAWNTAREVIPFLTDKCRIPVIKDVHVFEKVIKLFDDYSLLKKNRYRKSTKQSERETAYKEKLNMLFDIAVSNALDLMTVEEDKQFLISQRLPGRPGLITAVKDYKLAQKEEESGAKKARTEKRREQEFKLKTKFEQESKSQGKSNLYL